MSIAKLNGTLVYVQVNEPKQCFAAEKGEEWKASIVVSEDDAEAWDDTYPKQTAKQVKTSEFESIYKIPAPFPNQRKQYVITARKNTKLGNGNPVPIQYQPKVFQKKGNTLVDVTTSVLPANGSVGAISIESYEGKMGIFARLKNVLVTEMIEYKRADSGSSADGSEFGFEVQKADDGEGNEVKVPAKAAAKPKKVVVEDDEDLSDSPF
jgi:hypothetical protein